MRTCAFLAAVLMSAALTAASAHALPINLALASNGGVAAQSSTYQNSTTAGLASDANDGNRNGAWNFSNPAAGSVSHTQSQSGAWWEVTLAGASAIGNVNVFNRIDCCETRLTNGFTVSLFNGSTPVASVFRSGAYDFTALSPTLKWFEINFGGAVGDRVRIQLASSLTAVRTGYLHLAEVEVYAVPLPAAAWLFISALGGLVLVGRRRRMHEAVG